MASSSSQTPQVFLSPAPTKINDAVYEFYKPATGFIDLEIVFFHGFQGQDRRDAYLKTWMVADESACWLSAWLPEKFPQSRILSVSYDSSIEVTDSEGRMDMYLVGENLARSIIDLAEVGQTSPVVLVGHCVGGLVLKEVCCRAEQMGARLKAEGALANAYETFLRRMKGAFFFSTAQMGSRIQAESKERGPLLKYYCLLSSDSARLTSDFSKLRKCDVYGWKTSGVSEANETETSLTVFQRVNFFSRMFGMKRQRSLVVDEASARIDMDTFSVLQGTDSLTICKPKDKNSDNYLFLVKFLRDILESEEWLKKQWQHILHFPRSCKSMPNRVEEVLQTLQLGQAEPSRVSLVGMGGIGKTTLAKQIFVEIAPQFDFICFVEDVKSQLGQDRLHTLISNNLYSGGGHKVWMQDANIQSLWLRLKEKKVLLVMDNVDSEEEIHILLVADWVAKGSRLITTSREQPHELMPSFVVHNVRFLSSEESRSLFLAHIDVTVVDVIPSDLIDCIVEKCDGLPLTLEVIGSYLGLQKDISVWNGALNRLGKAESITGSANDRLWGKLKLSFESLAVTERRMFLDLVVFDRRQYDLYIWKAVWEAEVELESVIIGFRNLIDKSFMHIRTKKELDVAFSNNYFSTSSEDAVYVYIHEQLRDMGRSICRPSHERIELCRGVWEWRDVDNLFVRCKRDNAQTETLSVAANRTVSPVDSPRNYSWSSVGELQRLRLLKMSDVGLTGDNSLRFPLNLALLHMTSCSRGEPERPFPESDCWPIRAEDVDGLHYLTVLILENCLNSVRFPENFHRLSKLRILIVTGGIFEELPREFGLLPSLQVLFLTQVGLAKLPDSFGHLSTLQSFELRDCSALETFPFLLVPNDCSPILNLKRLILDDLPALTELSEAFGLFRNLELFVLKGCPALSKLPASFGHCHKLKEMRISQCKGLEYLCESFGKLESLSHLDITHCPRLRRLPYSIGQLKALEKMDIKDLGISSPLAYVGNLGNLRYLNVPELAQLNVPELAQLNVLPESLPLQTHHPASDPAHNALGLPTNPKVLYISRCKELQSLPEAVGLLTNFDQLHISECDSLQSLPEALGLLTNLHRLRISQCESLKSLPGAVGLLTNLDTLDISGCASLQSLPEALRFLTNLQRLDISRCESLESLPDAVGLLTNLHKLYIDKCRSLQSLPESLGFLKNLSSLYINYCTSFQGLPDTVGLLTNLVQLNISMCENLQSLPETLGSLSNLQTIDISCCERLKSLPEALGPLTNLQKLRISRCKDLQSLPESLGPLTNQNKLDISGCESVQSLPETLGLLTNLHTITLSGCRSLQILPNAIGLLTNLRSLDISGCESLQSLPEALGLLPKLVKLDISARESLPEGLGLLTNLRRLDISYSQSLQSLPEALGLLTNLRMLDISYSQSLQSLPEALGLLTNLGTLKLSRCKSLQSLPEALGDLTELHTLDIGGCESLQSLPEALGRLTNLQTLNIRGCESLQSLPKALGHLRTK